ncbi:hypothetical protein NBZ79_03715 [Sneathiella marina]|uniref:AsmA domain-containing protein n=1 Tax=Sneathiella marina TaxID=2950108 RepID=A0ABY4W8J9_9PROT|nr:hypothetical protein [Sneathiella marina]USG62080.1 hypothetical protein NBZ79_03715 [Sneathiella marina]
MKRGVIISVTLLVLLFCGAIAYVYSSIGSVIQGAVENYGSEITKSPVTVQEAEFSPTSGDATIFNLVVGNPVGFSPDNAFSFPNIILQIDPETISQDTMVIKRIKIEAPEIIYEITEDGDNLRTIRKNIMAAVDQEKIQAVGSGNTQEKKFIVNDVYISNAVVVVQATGLTGNKVTAVLDDIHLQDIGRDQDGIGPAALVDEVYTPLLRAITVAAVSTDLNLSDQMRNIVKGAADETEGAIDRLKELFKD